MKQYIQIELEEAKNIQNLLELTKTTNPDILLICKQAISRLDKRIKDSINDSEKLLVNCLKPKMSG